MLFQETEISNQEEGSSQTSKEFKLPSINQKQEIDPLEQKNVSLEAETYTKRLEIFRNMSREELLSSLTPENIEISYKNGNLFIVGLAIDSKEIDNVVEKTSNPAKYYKKMVEAYLSEAKEFRKTISESKKLSTEEIREEIKQQPYAQYFTREDKNRLNLDTDRMPEKELRATYEFCLLEEKVRAANIQYGGSSFYSTIFPEGMNYPRQGDCNGIAFYYGSLASSSGSTLLQESLKYLNTPNHLQLVLSPGKDHIGNEIHISKNSSYVNPDNIDSEGKDTGTYEGNFYPLNTDLKTYGLHKESSLSDVKFLVGSELIEINVGPTVIQDKSNEELDASLALMRKVIELSPSDITANENIVKYFFEMKDRKLLKEEAIETEIIKATERLINGSFMSAFEVSKTNSHFDNAATKELIIKYENKIKKDPKAFIDFIEAPIEEMRKTPALDRREQYYPNKRSQLSVGIINRSTALSLININTEDPEIIELTKKMSEIIDAEIRTWKPKPKEEEKKTQK